MVDPPIGLQVLAFALRIVIIGNRGSIKNPISIFIVGQVISLGFLLYAPLAQMAPFAIMPPIFLLGPTGLYGSPC